MGEIPEGRQALTWSDMPLADRPRGHPSTERLEIEKLTFERDELRALVARVLPLLKQGLDDFWMWQDDGPDGSGWPSDENTACREALEAWCAEAENVLGENDAERLKSEKLRARVANLEAAHLAIVETTEGLPGAIIQEWRQEARDALQEGE